MYDTIIIGAGPAGLYAATSAAMQKLNACILESAFEYGGTLNLYKQKMVYDMPGFVKISAGELINQFYEQYAPYQNDIPLFLNTKALDVRYVSDHYEIVTNKGVFETKTILLANGGGIFEPRLLELEYSDSMPNIYYNIDNLETFRDKELVILGGGDSAVDWALTLSDVASRVTLVHRRNEFRAHKMNVEKIRHKGIVLTPYLPYQLKGTDKVTSIVLQHTDLDAFLEIPCDALFVFYGSSATKHQMDKWAVDLENNLIKVTPNMKTSREGIFAIGNSVTYPGKRKMIVTALGEAATAISTITEQLYPDKTFTYKH